MASININNIDIEINKKSIKHIRLVISGIDGKIKVSTPKNISIEKVKEFILSKWDWVEDNIKKYENKNVFSKKEYITGEEHLLFGRSYYLDVVENKRNYIEVADIDTIIMNIKPNSTNEIKEKLFEKFYKEELIDKLEILIPMWEEITDLKINGWKIQKMKTRWGSCNVRKKTITFNLELVKHSYKEIEYVILHELSHLVVPSHNKFFKAQVAKYMPNWKSYQNKLNNL